MAKDTAPTTKAESGPDAAPTAGPITVIEFCTRLSSTVRRPELIGAFCHVEQKAGRVKDTEAAFKGRFDEFINKPV
jgi:hypothetical protein